MKNSILFLAALFFLIGCRDNNFDEPPTVFDNPDITANTTIAELKASNVLGEFDQIEEDIIISGIVVADDRSGSFYKELIIQDETGGISLAADVIGLSNLYPIGRRVFVKCQNLWIGDNRGSRQIGASVSQNGTFKNVDRIPDVLLGIHLIGGAIETIPAPAEKTLSNLTPADYNTLIVLKDVEFGADSKGLPFANVGGGGGVNRSLVDCNEKAITVRNSDFSDFAGEIMSSQNGELTAIYAVYDTDAQLKIREFADINFTNPDCTGGGGPDPIDLEANMTIADLKASNVLGEFDEITTDVIIKGIVVADDRSGNYYKEIIIQDETGGISLALDAFDMFNRFPIGREVFVKCKNLWIGENRGSRQIGQGTVPNGTFTNIERIEESSISLYVFESEDKGEPTATVRALNSLGPDDYNTLITLDAVEFAASEHGNTFAEDGGDSGQNKEIRDCNGNSIIMRNSDYADFASSIIPDKNGTIKCIYTVFLSTPQIKIRELSDVSLNDVLCNGGGGSGNGELVTIQSIRDQWSGPGSTTNLDNVKIKGTVISDYAAENIPSRNIVMQSEGAGIVVRFDDDHTFALGDIIEVEVKNTELSDFNGLIQISNVPNSNATIVGTNTSLTPLSVTIAQINGDPRSYESELVVIANATISGNTTFEGNTSVDDGTGSIAMHTRTDASFATMALPSGAVTLTAIIGFFNEVQLSMRSADDIN